ncbi:hypothetical protein [Caballeronia sp. HLA56]
MQLAILCASLHVLLLAGCAVGGVTPLINDALKKCDDDRDIDCIIEETSGTDGSGAVRELKPSSKDLPSIGLAMSGGGSKAAPFAMGVLKRFIDGDPTPWIFRTEYLSSVSGSGYSAFYMYSKAYILATDKNVSNGEEETRLRRFFVDARYSASKQPYNVEIRSIDAGDEGIVFSLPDMADDACYHLTTPSYAPFSGTYEPTKISSDLKDGVHQGWVECYQDILVSSRSVNTADDRDTGKLARSFGTMAAESLMAAPIHYFSNLVFDWRKRLSPTQYDYLFGIVRTYGYAPEPGKMLPAGSRDPAFEKIVDCFTFSDLAEIYTQPHDEIKRKIGGYLPKWILQATGTSGNVGVNLSREAYNLPTDVFEITFDEFGSGRYHYVRGSPDLVGLTVPMAVLSSAAFADTAQRSLRYSRATVNAVLQVLNLRWGFDIINYNTSNWSRVKHSFLPWPFYFYDDPDTGHEGPTIHLSDGGQSGDNLGMVSLLRRSVRHIIVANGENDWHRDPNSDGFMSMSSLCSVNYYLVQHGYTMTFKGDPRKKEESQDRFDFDLSERCTWDKDHRFISIQSVEASRTNDVKASPVEDSENITPFNWKRRVWLGEVRMIEDPSKDPKLTRKRIDLLTRGENLLDHKELFPKQLDGIKIYYMMAALDKDEWTNITQEVFRRTGGEESNGKATPCLGAYPRGFADGKNAAYPCGLIQYVHDTIVEPPGAPVLTKEEQSEADKARKWVFPQNSTTFTTYSNSVELFRAYRDLGWAYANSLPASDPELAALLTGAENEQPQNYKAFYDRGKVIRTRPPICAPFDAFRADSTMVQRN